jgi:hypothetical protein
MNALCETGAPLREELRGLAALFRDDDGVGRWASPQLTEIKLDQNRLGTCAEGIELVAAAMVGRGIRQSLKILVLHYEILAAQILPLSSAALPTCRLEKAL